MRRYLFVLLLILLATSASAYYSQNGIWEGRTRIDEVGSQATNGAWQAERYTGGMHPVTADFNAPFTGYIGAFDLEGATQPSLTVTKSDSPDPVVTGHLLNYTIVINSVGTANATNAVATETYPAGVRFVSSSPAPSISNNTWNIGQLNVGQTYTINITVNVTAGPGIITNNINVTYQNSTGASFSTADSETTTVVSGQQPVITISKTGSPDPVYNGFQLNYTILVTNAGILNATNVNVTETYPAGVVFNSASPAPSAGDNIWALGNLTPGQTVSINITVNVTAAGALFNLVNATWENASGGLFSDSANTTTTALSPQPNLSITKSGSPNPVRPGNQLFYTITFTNNGPITAYNITVNETYPAGVVYSTSSPAPVAGNFSWLIANITPGQTKSINITVNVTVNSGTLVNLANVTYENSTGALFKGSGTASNVVRRPRPSGGGGGGGGSAGRGMYIGPEVTHQMELEQELIEVKYGDTISYTKDGVEHLVYVNAITRNGVQLLVDDGVEYTIPLHGEGLFDLDADKVADLKMLVQEVSTNKALLLVNKLYSMAQSAFANVGMMDRVEVREDAVESAQSPKTDESLSVEQPSAAGIVKRKIPMRYAYMIPFILVAIILAALYFTRHKRPPKYHSDVEDINSKIDRLNDMLKKYK